MSASQITTVGESAQQCYSSWVGWNAASLAWKSSSAPRITTTETYLTTYIEPGGTGIPYTLDCDGISRLANFSITGTTTSVFSSVQTRTELDMTAIGRGESFKKAEPECSIATHHCDLLWEAWHDNAYGNTPVRLEQNGTPFIWDPRLPECRVGKCDCVVRGMHIALIHWSASAPVVRDRCGALAAPDQNTIRPTSTVPFVVSTTAISIKATEMVTDFEQSIVRHLVETKVLTGDFRFTSPSIYLAYASLWAERRCPLAPRPPDDIQISLEGSMHAASVVPLDPSDLYSVIPVWRASQTPNFAAPFTKPHGDQLSYTVEPFNLDNLADPVPASAYYAAMDDCWENRDCSVIPDGQYNPWLGMGQNVLEKVDPAWKTCKQALRGMFDPPVVLHRLSGDALAVPTLRNSAATTTSPITAASIASAALATPVREYSVFAPSKTIDLGLGSALEYTPGTTRLYSGGSPSGRGFRRILLAFPLLIASFL